MPPWPNVSDGSVCAVRRVQGARGAAARLRDVLGDGHFFSSPILFLCLLLHGVFAVGTFRDIHRGASHAVRYWKATKQVLKRRGDMAFARFGVLSFAQWKDKRLVRFVSTIHVEKKDVDRLPHNRWDLA